MLVVFHDRQYKPSDKGYNKWVTIKETMTKVNGNTKAYGFCAFTKKFLEEKGEERFVKELFHVNRDTTIQLYEIVRPLTIEEYFNFSRIMINTHNKFNKKKNSLIKT